MRMWNRLFFLEHLSDLKFSVILETVVFWLLLESVLALKTGNTVCFICCVCEQLLSSKNLNNSLELRCTKTVLNERWARHLIDSKPWPLAAPVLEQTSVHGTGVWSCFVLFFPNQSVNPSLYFLFSFLVFPSLSFFSSPPFLPSPSSLQREWALSFMFSINFPLANDVFVWLQQPLLIKQPP